MKIPIVNIKLRSTLCGFTLIELMLTIAIASILMMIAVPSMRDFVVRGRISRNTSDLVGAINLARSEAVKRGSGVTLCRSSDDAGCSTVASGWDVGWIVFADPDFDGTVDAGEEVIRAFPAFTNGTTAVATAGLTTSLTYSSLGRPGATFSGANIQICPPSGLNQDFCKFICLNSQGRPKVDTPAEKANDALCGN